jgi:hypothetical protein
MGLLRDSKSTIIDPSTGRLSRAGDPEYHIKRLQDFSAGMGFDITSLKGDVTNKGLHSYTDIEVPEPISSNLLFSVHDEGLDTPHSVIQAADKAIKSEYGTERNSQITQPAWEELWHRSPYNVFSTDSGNTGDIYKRAVDHSPRYGFGSGITETWDTENSEGMEPHLANHPNFQSALKNTRYKFKVENMERSAPGRDVIDVVQQALRNPDEKALQHILRTKPHLHSGQFVNVGYVDDSGLRKSDMLDLGTGTWAKIEPDGYFPT